LRHKRHLRRAYRCRQQAAQHDWRYLTLKVNRRTLFLASRPAPMLVLKIHFVQKFADEACAAPCFLRTWRLPRDVRDAPLLFSHCARKVFRSFR
jgi:hypothetical protein